MSEKQNLRRWRETIVAKLRDRYGLTEEEARMKTEIWMHFIDGQPQPAVTGTRRLNSNLSNALLLVARNADRRRSAAQ